MISPVEGRSVQYRGRLAPSPTGYLHLGHARTFWIAQQRAIANNGVLVLRNEDLDPARCKPEFVSALIEDLRWFGFHWQEGPDCGGLFGPYTQSQRHELHHAAFEKLRQGGFLYPCTCSRQDVLRAIQAPHEGEDEPLYPGTCRENGASPGIRPLEDTPSDRLKPELRTAAGAKINWRFRVPDGESISFEDGCQGLQTFIAGKDFGDFVVWRNDGVPAYQLAVVVDDVAMGITEVVRGADLLKSTARQILLFRALDLTVPSYYHCPLLLDDSGVRLAKRHDALSLRTLRLRGVKPKELVNGWNVVKSLNR